MTTLGNNQNVHLIGHRSSAPGLAIKSRNVLNRDLLTLYLPYLRSFQAFSSLNYAYSLIPFPKLLWFKKNRQNKQRQTI